MTAKRSRFVQPSVVRLALSNDDWLDVRRELTVGEQRKAMAKTISTMRADGRIEPNMEMIGKSEISAYIVDWSFVDANGKSVPFSESALDNLTPADYSEVDAAVRAHIAAVEDDRKKAESGSSQKSS